MRSIMKKAIAVLLCLILTFSAIPVSAASIEIDRGESAEGNIQTSGLFSVAGWVLNTISTVAFNTTISFGVNKLLNMIFPASESPNPQLEEINQKLDILNEKLDTISANQIRTYNKLVELEDFITNDQYLEILNDYNQFLNSTSFVNYCYNSLNSLSAEDEDELADMQLSLLTDEIGIQQYNNANTLIDQKRSEYYNYISSLYYVQVDGRIESKDIFGIYRELMRNTYCWENNAQSLINEFNECVIMNYLFITLVDILSIEARITLIDEHNADPANASNKWSKTLLENLLKNEIPAETQKVLQLYTAYTVDIPQNYFHFWKGNGDFWFDSTVYSTSKGNEQFALVSTDSFRNGNRAALYLDTGEDFNKSSGFTGRTFQKEFFRTICDENKPENSELITTEIINTMLDSCSNARTLGDILSEVEFTNGDKIDSLLLNVDDTANAGGTYKSTISYKYREDMDLTCNSEIAYLRYISDAAVNEIADNGAGKTGVYCYIDLNNRPELANNAKTLALYCSDSNPLITDCDRLFVYDADDIETCAHTVLTEKCNVKAATCAEEGYTGDTVCLRCGKTLYDGETIEKLPHEYELNGTDYICRNCGDVKAQRNKVCGDFTVSYYDETADFSYSDGVLNISTECPLEIKNTNPEAPTTDIITVSDNTDARITLAGVRIDVRNNNSLSPISAVNNSTSDVTVMLKEKTENYLYAGNNCAALEKDGTGGSLTINGSGYLYACGGNNGAAIGSGYGADTSDIVIKSGVITADCGIGCGEEGASSDIVIFPTASVKADSITCVPVNDKGEQVYLNIKKNPYNQPVFVDGVKFPYTNHSGEEKVYIYLNGGEHEICFPINGKNGAVVDYENRLVYGISPLSTVESCVFTPSSINCSCDASEKTATGKEINIYDSETDYGTYTFVLFGDVNGDGVYDGTDSVIVNCLVNGLLSKEQVGEAVYTAADCNHDDVIDSADVAILEQAGLILASVDQTKTEAELMTDSAFVEYLNLIDQSADSDADNITENNPTEEPAAESSKTLFDFLKQIVKRVFSFIRLYFSTLKLR